MRRYFRWTALGSLVGASISLWALPVDFQLCDRQLDCSICRAGRGDFSFHPSAWRFEGPLSSQET
jgi:hypothetical protein